MDFLLGIIVGLIVCGIIKLYFENTKVTINTFSLSDEKRYYKSYSVSYKKGFKVKSETFVRMEGTGWYNENTGQFIHDDTLREALDSSYRAYCFKEGVLF